MNKDQTKAFLKALNATIPSVQGRTGWVLASCPLGPWRHEGGVDKNPSFGIRITPGDADCHCFSCDYHGKMSDLATTLSLRYKAQPRGPAPDFKTAFALLEGTESDLEFDFDAPDVEEALFAKKKADLHPFAEKWLATFPRALDIPFARDYLQERGVSDEVATFLDLRADTTRERVCFPVRDFKGTLMGLHGRNRPGIEPRYHMYLFKGQKNQVVWLGESWVDFSKPVVFVEGPFDLAAVLPVYPNVVSPLFASPGVDKLRRMQGALEIFTLYDHGTGGSKGRQKVSSFFRKGQLVTHLMPPPHRKDPGECTPHELLDLFEQAGLLSSEE